MGKIVLKIVLCLPALIIGFFIALFGIITISDSSDGLGDLEVYRGRLKVVTQAKEEPFGLTDMGPVIFREARMYQWKEERTTSKYHQPYAVKSFEAEYIEPFSAYPSRDAAAYQRGELKEYKNPAFPKELLDGKTDSGETFFCGEVEIGDTGVRLDSSLLGLFMGDRYCMDDCRVPAGKTPKNAGKKFGLTYVGKGHYATGKGDKHKIGDMDVVIKVVDPEVLKKKFTAVGVLSEDKVLSMDEGRGALYDRVVSDEEIDQDYKKDMTFWGLIIIATGVAIPIVCYVVISVIVGLFARREE